MEGTPFGHYRLVELLGRGGMGEVWQAFDTRTERPVALKVLPAHLSQDWAFNKRFLRNMPLAARLGSPHVIPIHDFGEIDGSLYVDMQLIDGRDLEGVLAEERLLHPARAVGYIEQVAEALHDIHSKGLLHGDVKPSNIFISRQLRPVRAAPADGEVSGDARREMETVLSRCSPSAATLRIMSNIKNGSIVKRILTPR